MTFTLRRQMWAASFLALVLTAGAVMTGCTTAVPATRTLPSHIQRIYVPEFRNQSREFGLQAPLTLEVVDAFLSDGRLDVVDNERADVRLEGVITRFRSFPTALGSDRIPMVETMQMEITVELWDPYDADRVAPLYRFTVPAVIQYVSDTRRSIMETRTEALSRLVQVAAQNIKNAVLTGAPLPLTPLEQGAINNYRTRKGPQNYAPVEVEPRFPDPLRTEGIDL